MSNKKGNRDIETGNDVVNFAKKRNADVYNSGNFTAIETPNGKMFVKDNNEKMDKHTKSNVKKWLRLLGLMIVLLPVVLNYLANLAGFQINWF